MSASTVMRVPPPGRLRLLLPKLPSRPSRLNRLNLPRSTTKPVESTDEGKGPSTGDNGFTGVMILFAASVAVAGRFSP